MHHLRFRQIHLDFHTSPAIPEIGAAFDKAQWQETLKLGHVDSITTFSKCHHGWSYHPTKVGKIHPHLAFDLLRAQFDAAKEIDVNVPIYISAGVDNVASQEHPEWREISQDGAYQGWTGKITQPGFHMMCFGSPYLDYLCDQIVEVVRAYPNCDGIFLDIISQGQCCCTSCIAWMHERGLDARDESARSACRDAAMLAYYERTTAACKIDNPHMPVFHNSGHISPDKRDILPFFSHLELESLPTGGWGYDHFPASAKYALKLPYDFLGMTGKFHTTWGEFGGFKHPNALRYECAAMLAFGSKCSVGDQLHPNGQLDESTYAIIGEAYAEVEAKEPWADHVQSVADIGLLINEAVEGAPGRNNPADIGASRILLEGHYLFDILDPEMDFGPYRLIILPDSVPVNDKLRKKLNAYLKKGGKLLFSGDSALQAEGGFVFDIGAEHKGKSELNPDYVLPINDLQPTFCKSPMVMYGSSHRIKVNKKAGARSLGKVYDSYFNRDYRHFCSHQHTPNKPKPSGYDAGSINGNICYVAHPIFTIYRQFGQVALQEYILHIISSFLGEDASIVTNMPSTARVSLMEQPKEKRYILHLLYANTIRRGGGPGGRDLEVIEELLPLHDTELRLKLPRSVKKVTLEPQGKELEDCTISGKHLSITLNKFTCHQMLVLHYG